MKYVEKLLLDGIKKCIGRRDMGLARKKIEHDHAIFSLDNLEGRIKEIGPLWDSDLKPLAKSLPSYEVAANMLLKELKKGAKG
ncbi:hypothetical protein M1373_00295 [Candidatus Marsarchaeota archaeon]|nr:hypothetical protein [Candidatus Marsarchaeota archaeon]MCL5404495.1 hypothetical protein [Candidatus Marsarchaeota archaeon]